jgi:hypothetical protein
MNKLIGALGSVFLAVCGFPAMMDVIDKDSAAGYSVAFIALWGLGELFSLIYVLNKDKDKIQLFNYIFNLTFISVILYYML